jgi:hypothetical protein
MTAITGIRVMREEGGDGTLSKSICMSFQLLLEPEILALDEVPMTAHA